MASGGELGQRVLLLRRGAPRERRQRMGGEFFGAVRQEQFQRDHV